jgi:hypothetical protein
LQGGVEEGLLGDECPQVQVVAGGAALETTEGVLGKVRGEGSAAWRRRFMDRTRATPLLAASRPGLEVQQLQDFGHADRGPQAAKVEGGHGRAPQPTSRK